MIRSFLFFSIFLACLSFASCSKSLYPTQSDYTAIVKVEDEVQKYKMEFKFMKTHLSAILAVRKMESGEIRMVGASPFGLSLFDFGLREDTFAVYSCIEPLRKQRLLKILENDFSTLFLPNRMVKKIKQKKDRTEYLYSGGLAKGVIQVYNSDDSINIAEDIRIKHSWIRLFIQLEKMENNNVKE